MARTTGRCAPKKTRRTRSIAHLAGFARLGEDRESGGPQFFFVFLGGTKKKEKILNPLYPFSQKKVCKVCKPCSTLFTTPLVPRVTSPPLYQPL